MGERRADRQVGAAEAVLSSSPKAPWWSAGSSTATSRSKSSLRKPATTRSRNSAAIPLVASFALLWATIVNLLTGTSPESLLASNGLAALSLVAIFAAQRPLRLNGVVVYSILLWAFHFGLVGLLVIGVNVLALVRIDYSWILDSEPLVRATSIAACGLASFGCGANLVKYLMGRNARPKKVAIRDVSQEVANSIVGVTLLFSGLALWFYYFALAGGPVDYDSWLALTAGGRTWLAYLLILVGMPFVAAGVRGRVLWLALIPFSVFALIAFFSGLRGFVIYPVATYLIADARVRNRSLALWRGVLLGAAVFFLSIAAREIRQVGILRASEARSDVSYLTGLIETGTSIRPLYEAVIWHELQGVPFSGVNAVLNPIVYAANAFGIKSASWDIGANSLSIRVGELIGPYGGSVIAEAYNAFSWGGVLLGLLLVGAVIASMDGLPRKALLDAVGPAVIGLLLYTLRQDSTGTVINALLLAGATGLSRVISSTIASSSTGSRPSAPARDKPESPTEGGQTP